MTYRRLLVPLDGSHLGESVLPLVRRIGAQQGSTIVLLHILERGAPAAVHGERHLRTAEEGAAYLEGIAGELKTEGFGVEVHVHEVPEGDVARSIVAHGEEHGADLIVLCTHGGGRVRHLLFGSIAQQVLNRGTKPVLLARPAPNGSLEPFMPRRVLVPLDATGGAEAALGPAEQMARALRAALHLVMVVPTQETIRGDRVPTGTLLPSATRAALDMEQQQAANYLEDLAAMIRSPDLPVTTEVRRGETASVLVDEAAESGVGLVVLATHGRAGLQAVWAGSVTARLLSRTHAPVLLLRTVEGKGREPSAP